MKVSLNDFAILFKNFWGHGVLKFYVTIDFVKDHAKMSIFKKGNFSKNMQFEHRDYVVIHCMQSNCAKHGTGEDVASSRRRRSAQRWARNTQRATTPAAAELSKVWAESPELSIQ